MSNSLDKATDECHSWPSRVKLQRLEAIPSELSPHNPDCVLVVFFVPTCSTVNHTQNISPTPAEAPTAAAIAAHSSAPLRCASAQEIGAAGCPNARLAPDWSTEQILPWASRPETPGADLACRPCPSGYPKPKPTTDPYPDPVWIKQLALRNSSSATSRGCWTSECRRGIGSSTFVDDSEYHTGGELHFHDYSSVSC